MPHVRVELALFTPHLPPRLALRSIQAGMSRVCSAPTLPASGGASCWGRCLFRMPAPGSRAASVAPSNFGHLPRHPGSTHSHVGVGTSTRDVWGTELDPVSEWPGQHLCRVSVLVLRGVSWYVPAALLGVSLRLPCASSARLASLVKRLCLLPIF